MRTLQSMFGLRCFLFEQVWTVWARFQRGCLKWHRLSSCDSGCIDSCFEILGSSYGAPARETEVGKYELHEVVADTDLIHDSSHKGPGRTVLGCLLHQVESVKSRLHTFPEPNGV